MRYRFQCLCFICSMMDVDFGDLIDYFGDDPETKSIIIYMETIGNTLASVKNFMLQEVLPQQTIIVINRAIQGSIQAAKSHTRSSLERCAYL